MPDTILLRFDRFLWGRPLRSNAERFSSLSAFAGLVVGPFGFLYGIREAWLAFRSIFLGADIVAVFTEAALVFFYISVARANALWFARGFRVVLLREGDRRDDREDQRRYPESRRPGAARQESPLERDRRA